MCCKKPMILCAISVPPAPISSPASLLEPLIFQQLPRRRSIPRIQFHHLHNKVSIRPLKFFILRPAESETFRIGNLLEPILERPEMPDLLNEDPKPVMLIVKGDVCWRADVPVFVEDETDQLRCKTSARDEGGRGEF